MSTEQVRSEFEAWCETRSLEVGIGIEGDYISLETYLSWEGYKAGRAALLTERDMLETEVLEQARLNGMGSEREARLMAERDALRDALWVVTEHNALHFGESHNTVVQGRAALAQGEV